MNTVAFHYADKKLNSNNKNKIKDLVKKIFELEAHKLDRIDYIFCSDEYLLTINQTHLQHDYYTDIITFDLSENDEEIISEVYVSLDRIKDNAKQLNQPLEHETLRVIFHGALHLCGFKDKTDKDSAVMRKKEEEYIQLYLKTNPK